MKGKDSYHLGKKLMCHRIGQKIIKDDKCAQFVENYEINNTDILLTLEDKMLFNMQMVDTIAKEL